MPLTTEQYRTLLDVQRSLVRDGWHPAVAGQTILRAVDRISPGGMSGCGTDCCCCRGNGLGRVQMRSLRRDMDPSIPPRQTVQGEQCVRIAETDGVDETSMWQRLDDYRSRGWTVMEIASNQGFPSGRVYWACPPGRTPLEAQNQILAAQLGATTAAPTVAAAAPGSPSILTEISSAGDDPGVTAARNIVSKWSWLIPVGGLLMSAKSKVSGLLSKNDPAYAAAKSLRRR
jgi:hypothetical protein